MEDASESAALEDLPPVQPEACVRRRLVQSTLFPLSKKEQICKGEDCRAEEELGENDGGGEEAEEEEELDGKSKKRKRNSSTRKKKAINCNSKTTPRSRASKQGYQVPVNQKEISCIKVDEGESPDIIRSDFFLENLEKGNQENEQNGHISAVVLEENAKSCSPNSPTSERTPRKLKQKANSVAEQQKKTRTTPKKKQVNGGLKEAMSKKTLSEILSDEPSQQLIPNLRLEAKITAEENLRMFAGRQIHPFFSSWKTNKRNQEIIDVENTCSSAEKKEPRVVFNPIHVFDMVEDDTLSLDWGNWLLCKRNSVTNSYDLETSSSSAYVGHANPLQFDDILNVGCPAIALECRNESSMNQCHDKDCLVDRIEASSTSISCNDKRQGSFVLQSYGNQQENCLWTDKFQPRKAAQICGNIESVRFLSDWLCLWHEKVSLSSKSGFHDDKAVQQDNDYCCSESDPDSDNVYDETSLNNVLLVTGPVGSGKSAAIYACAEEQGFQIIEVNASDWRNGALVKQRFGEALESHWLQHKVDKTADSEKKPLSKSFQEIIGVTKGSDTGVVELIPSSYEDSQLNDEMHGESACGQNAIHDTENATKTLILFEDVDVVLSEDHGFLSTIQKLARKAKRPMILTANSDNPVLPSNLKRVEVSFGIPSLKELLGLGHLVCEAEKAKVHPRLIERFVESCRGDIRKTIMHLQFWCQGQSSRKGNGSQISYSPLPFDVEAGHHVLPKLIPWGSTSHLSEIVEEEITKSLVMMEERKSPIEIVAEEELMDGKSHRTSRFHGGETDFIDAKKEAILSLHCSNHSEDDLLALPDFRFQTSNSSESPVAFCKRNVRRKLEAVISSDSDEEYLGDSAPTNLVRPFCTENSTLLDLNSISSPHRFTIGRCCQQTDHLSHIEEDKKKQTSIECSENGSPMDVSSVPESSFVPETEVDDKTEVFSAAVSCSFVLHKLRANSTSNNVLTNSILVKSENHCTPSLVNHEMLGNGSDVDRATLHREEVGDSHLEHEEDSIRHHPPMLDECSRVDFTGGVKNLEKLRSHQQIDSIEETWRRLLKGKMDLQQYVTLEEKEAFQALEAVSGMSDLISEVDLLLSPCQPLICLDSLEPSLLPCESTQLCSWYDDHLQMSSTMAQHGICFYAKKTVLLGSKRGFFDRVDLAWEMLSFSNNKMALGKLFSMDSKIMEITEMKPQTSCSSLRSREMDLSLCNILQSLVSMRASLSMRGDACHDYLASLSKISRLESVRLSEQVWVTKQRRARIPRHYLSSGKNALSPEDISLLSQHSCYGKFLPNQERSLR